MTKEIPNRLYLVNMYDGQVQNSFDNADELVAYLKRKNEAGSLMGEPAFEIFWGRHLSTDGFWKSAFKHAEKP